MSSLAWLHHRRRMSRSFLNRVGYAGPVYFVPYAAIGTTPEFMNGSGASIMAAGIGDLVGERFILESGQTDCLDESQRSFTMFFSEPVEDAAPDSFMTIVLHELAHHLCLPESLLLAPASEYRERAERIRQLPAQTNSESTTASDHGPDWQRAIVHLWHRAGHEELGGWPLSLAEIAAYPFLGPVAMADQWLNEAADRIHWPLIKAISDKAISDTQEFE